MSNNTHIINIMNINNTLWKIYILKITVSLGRQLLLLEFLS